MGLESTPRPRRPGLGALAQGGVRGRWVWSWVAVAEGVEQDTGRWTQQPHPPPATAELATRGHQSSPPPRTPDPQAGQ